MSSEQTGDQRTMVTLRGTRHRTVIARSLSGRQYRRAACNGNITELVSGRRVVNDCSRCFPAASA